MAQASLSLPGSPLQRSRRVSRSSQAGSNTGSHSYSCRRHWLRSSHHLDTRDQLPWVDDSRVGSPTSLYLVSSGHSRHNSYSSHTSRLTYNSHGELTRPGPGPHPALLATRWSHWVEGFHTNNDTVPYSLSPVRHTPGHNGGPGLGLPRAVKEVLRSTLATPGHQTTPGKQRLSVQFPVSMTTY